MRAGDSRAALRFAEAADQYVRVLREHIQKENMVLFNMAEQVLTKADEPGLMKKFDDVDRNQIGEAEIRRLIGILDRVQAAVPVT
jgi:hemerythrin-like domain-containing protein